MIIPPSGAASYARGLPGDRVGGNPVREVVRPLLDTVGSLVQADDLLVGGASNSETYSVTFEGSTGLSVTLTAATDSSSSATELIAALVAAADASPNLWTLISGFNSEADRIEVLWRSGVTGTITPVLNPGSQLSVASVTAASDQVYLYGRAAELVAYTGYGQEVANQGIRPVQTGAGPVITLTVDTNDDTETATIRIVLDGEIITATATAGASTGATATAIAAALTTALDGTGATATADDPDVVIAFPGGSKASALETSGTATLAISSVETAGAAAPHFVLVTRDKQTSRVDGVQGPPTSPRAGQPVSAADLGGACVYATERDAAAASGSKVYVETTAGTTLGRLYATPSPSRFPWPGARFEGSDATHSFVELA